MAAHAATGHGLDRSPASSLHHFGLERPKKIPPPTLPPPPPIIPHTPAGLHLPHLHHVARSVHEPPPPPLLFPFAAIAAARHQQHLAAVSAFSPALQLAAASNAAAFAAASKSKSPSAFSPLVKPKEKYNNNNNEEEVNVDDSNDQEQKVIAPSPVFPASSGSTAANSLLSIIADRNHGWKANLSVFRGSKPLPPPPPLFPLPNMSERPTLSTPDWATLQEASARLLFMAVRWVKCLGPFQTLSLSDQVS